MTVADITTIYHHLQADLVAVAGAALGLALIAAGGQWIKRMMGY